jgi:hypothetical protein
MKLKSIKYLSLAAVLVAACAEPEIPNPVPAAFQSTYTADFSFINAVADGPAGGLDFYVNNTKIGNAKTFLTGVVHTTVPITTNAVGANTNIRVKANGGTIGGVLGTNDLIYRAGNNNSNNFVATATVPATATAAASVTRYTLIALDSITRKAPVRKLNAGNFGDTTYFNPVTSQYISVVERAALTAGQKAKLAGIGTVPLGSSDPGGPRFCLLTDTYIAATLTSATASSFRVINASPNAPALYARLKLVAGTGATFALPAGTATAASYIMAFPTFSPSVGSRSTTSAFGAGQTTVTAGVSNVYDIEIATDSGFASIIASATAPSVTFLAGKHYSVVISGIYGKTLKVNAIQHN